MKEIEAEQLLLRVGIVWKKHWGLCGPLLCVEWHCPCPLCPSPSPHCPIVPAHCGASSWPYVAAALVVCGTVGLGNATRTHEPELEHAIADLRDSHARLLQMLHHVQILVHNLSLAFAQHIQLADALVALGHRSPPLSHLSPLPPTHLSHILLASLLFAQHIRAYSFTFSSPLLIFPPHIHSFHLIPFDSTSQQSI